MAVNAGQKFEGYSQIANLDLSTVWIVLDKSDTTMSPDGTTKYCNGQQMAAFFAAAANPAVENRYLTITQMLLGQASQTEGRIQFAADATLDPTVDGGYAYYDFLGTTNGLLTDYRKLTQEEVNVVVSSYNVFRVKELGVSVADPGVSQIAFQTASTKVSHVRFDSNYSNYINRDITALSEGQYVWFIIDNITQQTRSRFQMISVDTDDASYVVKVAETEAHANFAEGDRVEVFFISATHYVDIGGYSVRKVSGYTSLTDWEVGDTFSGWASSDRYVVGKVVGLPFDVDDSTKVKLAIDNTIF